jgi:hypothetical protein
MAGPFFALLTNCLNDVEFSLWNALMDEDTAHLQETGASAGRAKRELLHAFADLQLRAGTQSIARPKGFGKDDSSELIEF